MKHIQVGRIGKMLMFTDIHWGARSNSTIHNQDNLDFIDWVISLVTSDITHIAFLGDWFENRSSINIKTLAMSTEGMRKLSALGLPIIFITGNHDLYQRHTRDVHSLEIFKEFDNVVLIDEPTIINDSMLFLPYLFDHEYKEYMDLINSHDYVFGHFEFKNFVITGYTIMQEHGPDHTLFNTPKRIFSGHYHKRQHADNVIYIGNVFPTTFGDVDDNDRGVCIFDPNINDVSYINWEECPSFTIAKLSEVVKDDWMPREKARVKCIIDQELTYTEAQDLRETLIDKFKLRDLILEEDRNVKTDVEDEEPAMKSQSIDEMVIQQLLKANNTKGINLDSTLLVDIYKGIKVEITENED